MPDNNLPERVGRLEEFAKNIHNDFVDLKGTVNAGFRDINSSLTQSRQVNWGVILSGIVVVGSIYAAAIRPITQDISRQETANSTLALAVLKRTEEIQHLQIDQAKLESEVGRNKIELYNHRDILDKRGEIIANLKNDTIMINKDILALRNEFQDVKILGSQLTRERLIKIEAKLGLENKNDLH